MARRLTDVLAGRGFLLLPAVALVVHELRYALAYGEEANAELTAQGHGYVDSLAPWLVLLLGLAVGLFLRRVARASAGRAASRPRRAFGGLWAAASLSLYGIFVAQESLEGLFASGHPGGLDAVVGNGGWSALVAAVALGAGVAALLRAAEAVVEAAARLAPHLPALEPKVVVVRPLDVRVRPRRPLATAAAGRAPPRPGQAPCVLAVAAVPHQARRLERPHYERPIRIKPLVRRIARRAGSRLRKDSDHAPCTDAPPIRGCARIRRRRRAAHRRGRVGARPRAARPGAGRRNAVHALRPEREGGRDHDQGRAHGARRLQHGLIAELDGWERELATTGAGEDERVSKVTWTSTGEGTAEGALFEFTGRSDPGSYTFQVEQSYSDGSVVDWAGPPDADEPAPVVQMEESFGAGGSSNSTLAIVALVVGVIALVVGGLALARAGGRQLA